MIVYSLSRWLLQHHNKYQGHILSLLWHILRELIMVCLGVFQLLVGYIQGTTNVLGWR